MATPPLTEIQDDDNHEYPTPVKAKINAIVEFNDAHGIQYFKEDIFRYYQVKRSRGYAMLQKPSTRQNRRQVLAESLGRHKIIPKKKLKEMEQIIEIEGIAGRSLTWESLGIEIGIEASGKTIR